MHDDTEDSRLTNRPERAIHITPTAARTRPAATTNDAERICRDLRSTYDPFEQAKRQSVPIGHRRLPYGVWGITDFVTGTVTLTHGLSVAEARCTLAHELIHLERGPVGRDATAAEEIAVEEIAAGRLVPPATRAEVATWCATLGMDAVCEALEVDEPLLEVALNLTRPTAPTAPLVSSHHAATMLGITPKQVAVLARRGLLEGEKASGVWWIHRTSVEAYEANKAARRRACNDRVAAKRVSTRWPAGPLLRQIALRGGDAACGVRQGSAAQEALRLARKSGTLTPWMADRLAVGLLGLTVWDLWDL